MATLAIRGHATRGKEVIELLEMLGGKQPSNIIVRENSFYTIEDGIIKTGVCGLGDEYYTMHTLEEFLEKFPYKVGDKVKIITSEVCVVTKAEWDDKYNRVRYVVSRECGYTGWFVTGELQPYKEQETMEELKINLSPTQWDGEQVIIPIPKGYEFAGVDDDNQQVVFEKVKPQYPKTYEECYRILYPKPDTMFYTSVSGYMYDKVRTLSHLLLCRDAYWKIAGEQMGLGKPWESNPSNEEQHRYAIYNYEGIIAKNDFWLTGVNAILVFPTEEMRDAFYDNFKELINECKELL